MLVFVSLSDGISGGSFWWVEFWLVGQRRGDLARISRAERLAGFYIFGGAKALSMAFDVLTSIAGLADIALSRHGRMCLGALYMILKS